MARCFLIAVCTHYLEGRTDYVYWVALVFTSTHFSPVIVKRRGRTVVGPWRAQASLGTCCICSGFSVQAIAEGGSFGLVSCRCCRGALPSGSTALAQCHAPGGRAGQLGPGHPWLRRPDGELAAAAVAGGPRAQPSGGRVACGQRPLRLGGQPRQTFQNAVRHLPPFTGVVTPPQPRPRATALL